MNEQTFHQFTAGYRHSTFLFCQKRQPLMRSTFPKNSASLRKIPRAEHGYFLAAAQKYGYCS